METLTLTSDHHSNIDTSRPFHSVKEAIAIFGERLLVGELYSPKPCTHNTQWKFSPNPQNPRKKESDDPFIIANSLKKLEAELEDTKVELKILKERESETEVGLATLNAELHKSMSKLAEAEAAVASKAVATRSSSAREEEMRRDLKLRMENSPTLGQIMSKSSEKQYYEFGGKKEGKVMKKKPIIPLLGDLFSRKKESPTSPHNFFYSSPPF